MTEDLFTGHWTFNFLESRLDTPMPVSWTQKVGVTATEIVVTEEIVRANNERSTVRVWARFDGTEYPVQGSPLIETIAYERAGARVIRGAGRRSGLLVLSETVTVSADGMRLTNVYTLQTGPAQVVRGVAVFERQ